jgi:hypothetical protein
VSYVTLLFFFFKPTLILPRRERLDSVDSLYQLVNNATILCEFLWAQIQIDLEKLNSRPDNSEDHSNEIVKSAKRMVCILVENIHTCLKIKNIKLSAATT